MSTPDDKMAVRQFDPLSAYENLDLFRDRVRGKYSTKSPSVFALEQLARSKPELARSIFKLAVVDPFYQVLATAFPAPATISVEGAQRMEELQSRFLQEPTYVLAMIECILVIERIEPWAEDTARLASRGTLSFKEARKYPGWYASFSSKGQELAHFDLAQYVRSRNYLIMLGLMTEIDGMAVQDRLKLALNDLPQLEGRPGDFTDDTCESLIGPDGVQKIFGWIEGDIEF